MLNYEENGVDFGKYKRSTGIEVSLCSLPSGQKQTWMLYSKRFNLKNPVSSSKLLFYTARPTPDTRAPSNFQISAAILAQRPNLLRWPFRHKAKKDEEEYLGSSY